jgi:hypothetical protein
MQYLMTRKGAPLYTSEKNSSFSEMMSTMVQNSLVMLT